MWSSKKLATFWGVGIGALRARRLAAKLDAVDGRTPEETEAFRAKARELRGE